MNSIVRSKFLNYYKQKEHYEDMTKYATLGTWILNSLGADIDSIEDLIGEYPKYVEDIKRSLNDKDLELIAKAKKLGLKYEITNNGVRLGLS